MIQRHLYATLADTRLHDYPAEDAPLVGHAAQGTWLGVMAYEGEWASVICHSGKGWVRLAETEERSPFALHARWKPGMMPQYFAFPGSANLTDQV